MLYITGENECLRDILRMEGYQGPLDQYCSQFIQLNSHLSLRPDITCKLPPYTPVLFVSQPMGFDQQAIARELQSFSSSERRKLKQLQDLNYDFLGQVVMQEIMEELQKYSAEFRRSYDDPLITTPWTTFNHSLTNASIPDILSEMSIYGSYRIRGSNRLHFFDQLYDSLLKRDDLNRRLLMLKGQQDRAAILARMNLEKEIKLLTGNIKGYLNVKINDKTAKYLSSFGFNEIRKMRTNSYSLKLAKKGQDIATRLDFLNKSGLTSLRKLVSKLKVIGDNTGKISTVLGVAAVSYDVGKAYYTGGSMGRAFLTGSAGIATSMALASSASFASFGSASIASGLTIAGLGVEGGAAVTALLCTPAGVIVLTVAGAAAVGYASYKVSEQVGELWDQYGLEITQKISSVAEHVYQDITSAWNKSSQWVLDWYGLKH